MQSKYERAKDIIRDLGKVAVAYSGGADSTLLLRCAIDTLGTDNVLAVIARSVLHPAADLDEAEQTATMLDARYTTIDVFPLEQENFTKNDRDRCYHCKTHLFRQMRTTAQQYGIRHIVEGSNHDDLGDFRPGMKACGEQTVISPLMLAGLTKDEIRRLSQALRLPTYNKPSNACLASRIPYGTPVDADILKKIEHAESHIKGYGINQVRVRYHGNTARIEIPEADFPLIIHNSEAIARQLQQYGFIYICLDLAGYRTGSMNE